MSISVSMSEPDNDCMNMRVSQIVHVRVSMSESDCDCMSMRVKVIVSVHERERA